MDNWYDILLQVTGSYEPENYYNLPKQDIKESIGK